MHPTNAIRAGLAYVELFADGSKLAGGLRAASAQIKAFGSHVQNMGLKLMGLGTAVIAPMLGAAKVYADTGAKLIKLSERTGASVEALSALQYAAGQADVEFESLTGGLTRMQRKIGDAATGSKAAQEALADLGLTAAQLSNLSVDEQFKAIADRIAGIEDPAIRTAQAMSIFGRGGAALLPLLKQGGAGIQAFTDRAIQMGLVISTKDAKAADEFHLALKDLWATVARGTFAIGASLAPVLKGCAQWITNVVARVREWIDTHRDLMQRILIGAGIVAGLGAAFVALGVAIKVVATVIGGIGGVLRVALVALKAVATVIAFLLTPLGAVLAVIAALGAYWLYASGNMGKLANWLGDKFKQLGTTAGETFQGIQDALAAGDFALAAKILWSGLKLAWLQGTAEIRAIMITFKWQLASVFLDIFDNFRATWEQITHAWNSYVDSMAWAMIRVWGVGGTDEQKKMAQEMDDRWTKQLADDVDAAQAAYQAAGQNLLAKPLNATPAQAAAADASVAAVDKAAANLAAAQDRQQKFQKTLMKAPTITELQLNEQDRAKKAEEDRHKKRMAEIGERNLSEQEAMKKLEAEDHKRALDALNAAQKEFDERRKLAAQERAAAETPKPELKPPPKIDIPAIVAATRHTVEVAGSFDTRALSGMGYGSRLAERTAKAAEDTAENTKGIKDRLDDEDGPTFDY